MRAGWMRPDDRDIARLAVPAFGALVAEPLYVLADTAIVGHIGTDELGGLAVASTVLLTLYAVFIFLAYGTTAAVARLRGAGDERAAAHQAVQSLWLSLGLAVAVGLLGLAFSEPLLRALGADGAVLSNGLIYLRISLLGLPALFATMAGTGWLRGVQDLRTPLIVAGATAVGNLVLQSVLIFGFGYGIGASALSTVVAQTAGAAVYVGRLARAARQLDVGLRPHPTSVGSLLRVGRDLLLRTAALRGALLLATAVVTRIGTTDLAAHQIGFEIWSFLALVLDAVAIAGQTLVGHRLGAEDGVGARAIGDRMLGWGLVLGVFVGAAVVATRTLLPGVFTDDAAVEELAAFVLLWVALMQPVNGVVFVLDGLLIGAGDQRFLAVAMVGAFAVFAPVVLAVGWLDLGLGWVWFAFGVLMTARLVALLARWRSDRWVVLGVPA